jgi:pre-rRNA-processing protein TSR3
VFWTFPDRGSESVAGYVRLVMEGPVLSAEDADRGLLVLDGTWRLAHRMEKFFHDLPARSLPPIQTAYPRLSRITPDPTGGLATIEAIYAAYRYLGRSCDGLLDHYHWAAEFLARNNWA